MNILVTAWYVDAANLSIENVVREMVRQNHYVEIFTFSKRKKAIWMFEDLAIPIRDINELSEEEVKRFDVAFAVDLSMRALRQYNIYVFSFNHIPDTWISEGSDFMFTMVRDRKLKWYEDCATMPIGSAKNDAPVRYQTNPKQILYIDAGHNPFGKKGKLQVANMLLEICSRFPDYKLVIKPRWFSSDIAEQPHLSKIHIYDVLKEISDNQLPENMICLDEYVNLQDLIDQSVSVITTSVSCYLDVALRNKGCIVVTGLDNEDQYDSRPTWKNVYSDAEDSGCCVKYTEVTNFLPEGIHCKEEHLDKRIAQRAGVSAKIVEVMQYVFDNYVSKGIYPPVKVYNCERYKEELKKGEHPTFEELKYLRLKNATLIITRLLTWIQNVELDFSSWTDKLEKIYRLYPLTEEGFRQLSQTMDKERKILLVRNRERLMDDAINQSLLLQAMYDSENVEEILAIDKGNILATGPYNYYLGCIFKANSLSKSAIKHFADYLIEHNGRSFTKYPQDERGYVGAAYNYVFDRYNGSNIPAEDMARLCISLHEQDATMVDYKLRKRIRNMLPDIAAQLQDENGMKLAYALLQLHAKTEQHYVIRELKATLEEQRLINQHNLNSISYKVGRVATFSIRKLRVFAKKVKKIVTSDNFSKIGDAHPFRIYRVFKNEVMKGESIYEEVVKQIGENAYLYLSAPSRGDTYILGSYYKEYLMTQKKNMPIFVVWGEESAKVAQLFGINNILVINRDEFNNLYHLLMFNHDGIIPIWSLHYHVFYRHTGICGFCMGLHGLNLNAISAAALNVDEAKKTKPVFLYDDKDLDDLFTSSGMIEGRTVVLAPYAKSVFPLQPSFWINLSKELKKHGYTVCTNVAGEEKPIWGTVALHIPFNLSVAFLEKAGATVGLRSGFQDVTSTAKCMKISLVWDNNPNPYVDCSNYDAFNLNDMYGEADQIDYLYDDEKEQNIISDIVGVVDNYICRS